MLITRLIPPLSSTPSSNPNSPSNKNALTIEPFLDIKFITEKLHFEIVDFVAEHRRFIDEFRPSVDKFIVKISSCIKEVFPEVDISLSGSHRTGQWMPWSGIDFSLVFPGMKEGEAFSKLKRLEESFRV